MGPKGCSNRQVYCSISGIVVSSGQTRMGTIGDDLSPDKVLDLFVKVGNRCLGETGDSSGSRSSQPSLSVNGEGGYGGGTAIGGGSNRSVSKI